MKVYLTNRNQITIPRALIKELGYKAGDIFDLSYDKETQTFQIKFVKDTNDAVEEKFNPVNNLIKNQFKRKIVSNLEEGSKFSRQVYSDCKLVIRTRKSYLKSFCEECKGQLSKEYGVDKYPCPYLNKNSIEDASIVQKEEKAIDKVDSTSSNILKDITSNVEKLNKKLDQDIKKLNNNSINIHTADTTIEQICYDGYKACTKCKEYFDKGFLLDDKFYCKKCAKEDFIEFYNTYKKGRN
jgi:hypothetical protein